MAQFIQIIRARLLFLIMCGPRKLGVIIIITAVIFVIILKLGSINMNGSSP